MGFAWAILDANLVMNGYTKGALDIHSKPIEISSDFLPDTLRPCSLRSCFNSTTVNELKSSMAVLGLYLA